MVQIDWTDEPERDQIEVPDEGHILAKISSCEHTTARSGSEMFKVSLESCEHAGSPLVCYDYIMLAGRGRGPGQKKLIMLGFQKGSDIEAHELEGREVYLRILNETYEDKSGKTRNRRTVDSFYRPPEKVEPGTPSWQGGYWMAEWPEPGTIDETPF